MAVSVFCQQRAALAGSLNGQVQVLLGKCMLVLRVNRINAAAAAIIKPRALPVFIVPGSVRSMHCYTWLTHRL